nr:hypothetical protein [Tanacetum cinerariifolium]
MVAILEKCEYNSDFHPMVDFIAASPLRFVPLFETMLVHQGEGSGIPTKPHHTPTLEADTSYPTTSSIPLPSIPTTPIPPFTQPDPTPIRQYSRRARIAQSSALPIIADEPASPVRDFWSTARIETTDEGTHILATVDGIQRTVSELSLRRNLMLRDEDGIVSIPDTELFENLTLMGYNISQNQKLTFQKGQFSHQWKYLIHTIMQCLSPKTKEPASPVRDVSEGEACPTDSGFIADQDRATIAKSSTLPHDSAPRVTSLAADEGSMQHTISELTALCTSLQRQYSELQAKFQAQEEEIVKLKERVKVLEDREDGAATQSGDDALIKGKGINEREAAAERISNDSEEIARVLTSMDATTILAGGIDVPTGSGSIPTDGPPATVISTGSEVGPTASLIATKRKGKEVMVESNTLKKKRLQEQIDAQVTRELQEQQEKEDMRMNEQIARDAEDNYSKVYKFQSQHRRPMTKKQKKEYYMAMIKNNLGWKVKDFKGMTFEEIEAKFAEVWKQVENFIPMGSKEETKRLKRKDLLKQLDREDLNQLWELVKEYLSIRSAISDKEMELWVELKKMYEPDPKDQLWTLTQNFMHALVEWKLYDLSGVHHLTAKDKEIFMLVEKDYPLIRGLALVMISYKLQVENYSQMAEDLIRKIYSIANTPRQQGD